MNYMINSVFFVSRMDQNTRLAFLFQKNAQKFIDVFSERHTRMWQFLSDLEKTAAKLDEMKKGASISTVAGSSVGIVGGVLSIVSLFFPPLVVPGAILGLISVLDTFSTELAETIVNKRRKHNAQSYIRSYKDDMIKIVNCLKEAAHSEGPLVQPSPFDVVHVVHITEGLIEGPLKVLDAVTAVKESKITNVIPQPSMIAVEGLENAHNTPQMVMNLTKIGEQAKALKILKIVRVASAILNAICIGLDVCFLTTESISLAKGSESEVSQLIRSRAALWKSELEAWEGIHDSLRIGIKTIRERQDTLEKTFLP